jgi:uncharacterized protein (TIGR02265 family)
MTMKTVDGGSVGELVAAGRVKMSPAAREKVAALGIAVDGELAGKYDAEKWAECVKVIAADLFPGVDEGEAQRRLAHLRMDEFARSWKGKLVFALARLSPKPRAVERFAHGLRRATNYVDTRFAVKTPGCYEIWISDVTGVPAFFGGMLEAGARRVTGRPATMTVTARDGCACTFMIAQ